MAHKYKVSQVVEIVRPGYADTRTLAGSVCEIVRQMPADVSGEYSYRVKTSTGGERAVRESEIRLPDQRK